MLGIQIVLDFLLEKVIAGKKGEQMDYSNVIMEKFRRLHNQLKRHVSMLGPGSYGRAQGRALKVIAANDGIRSAQLAALLGIRPATLTEQLDHLEEDGNIVRVRDQRDARVIHLHITEEGWATLAKRTLDDELLGQVFAECLTEEDMVAFCRMCDTVSEHVQALHQKEQGAEDQGMLRLNQKKKRQQEALAAAKKTWQKQDQA